MQQFVVPQFIDVEDKVMGPLSVRQFITLLVGAGLVFLLFKLLDLISFVFAAILVMVLLFVFAFVKINGRPFHYFLLSLFQTFRRPALKLWKKDTERYQFRSQLPQVKKKGSTYVPKEKGPLSSSRLTQISLVVDTGGAYDKTDDDQDEQIDPGITTLEI